MEINTAVDALAALAQGTRLEVFRALVQRGPDGLPAGAIASKLELPGPTLSFHLAQLKQAGLVSCRRDGRSLIYAADYAAIEGLVTYLTENCCGRGVHCVPDSRPRTRGRAARG
jgi:ArsR family transcriptional regulator